MMTVGTSDAITTIEIRGTGSGKINVAVMITKLGAASGDANVNGERDQTTVPTATTVATAITVGTTTGIRLS